MQQIIIYTDGAASGNPGPGGYGVVLTLAICGNFNLTNVDEVFTGITAEGQHPRRYADTYILLEQLGHRLDREVEHLYSQYQKEGLEGLDMNCAIEEHIDLTNVLKTTSCTWDGGYVICGVTGSGEGFAVRDPWGIRTAFWYKNDEVLVLDGAAFGIFAVLQTLYILGIEPLEVLQ